MSVTIDDFIAAKWFYQGRQRKARLGVIHCTQSPLRTGAARGVANDFANRSASNKASAHVICDDDETIGSVKTSDTAFAVPNANADGFHVEEVGYAEWTVEQWASASKATDRAATAMREACDELGIPLVWLGVDSVRNGESGITDHNTCTLALGGSHWDPGPNYHRDQFMALVRGDQPTPPPKEEDMALDSNWVRNGSELWVVEHGTDNAVWVRVFERSTGAWKPWESLGGQLPTGGDVTITGDPSGQVDINVIGLDLGTWHLAILPDNTRRAWEDLGGRVA